LSYTDLASKEALGGSNTSSKILSNNMQVRGPKLKYPVKVVQ